MHSPSDSKARLVSIIIPTLNEERNIAQCYSVITDVMKQSDCDYEVIIVDNDSVDNTPQLCADICARDSLWSFIKLSRNFSAEHSVAAGLRYCRGDAAIIFLSDLQEPAEVIPQFIEKWLQGYDLVYGINCLRPGESLPRRIMASFFYKLINFLSDVDLPLNSTDYRLMDRKVINAINRLSERNRYLRGLAHWVGFKKIGIKYKRYPREHGKSKTPFMFMLTYAIRSITTFSVKPLRLFLLGGLALLVFSIFMGMLYLALYITAGAKAYGIITVVFFLLANLGLTSFGFGVLGEYIGNIYNEAKRRHLWIVEETVNITIDESEMYGMP